MDKIIKWIKLIVRILEHPDVQKLINGIASLFKSLSIKGGIRDFPSPGEWLKEEALQFIPTSNSYKLSFKKENLLVDLEQDPQVWRTLPADTNSMDPVIDASHLTIHIAGRNPRDHQKILDHIIIGDIIIYQVGHSLILHRVVDITSDNEGRRFWTRGDNPDIKGNDPYVLRDEHVKYVMVGQFFMK